MSRRAHFEECAPENERHIPRISLRGLARRKGYLLVYGHITQPFGVQRRRGEPPKWFTSTERLQDFLKGLPDAPPVRR